MNEDKWKLKEGEGDNYNSRLQYGWRNLKEFYGRWILFFNLKPVELTEEFCEKHGIGVKECLDCEREGLLFWSKIDAEHFHKLLWGRIEYDKEVKKAMEAWWDPDKYYKISKI